MNRILISGLACLLHFSSLKAQWITTNGPVTGGTVRSLITNGTTIYCGNNDGVHRSTDNGSSWNEINTGLPAGFLSVPALHLHGGNLYAGTEVNGINLSANNGNSWTNINSGIPQTSSYAIAVCGNTLFSATFSAGVYASTDNGIAWAHVNGLGGSQILCFAVTNDTMYAGSDGNGIFMSTDGGGTWQNSSAGLPSSGEVESIVMMGSVLFAGISGEGVFRSLDHGSSWTMVNNGLLSTGINDLAVSGSALFAATTSDGVFLSVDSGGSWVTVNDGLVTQQNLYVTELAVNSTHLFAGTVAGGGNVWKRALNELISVEENSSGENAISVYPNPADRFFVVHSDLKLKITGVTVYNQTGSAVLVFQGIREYPAWLDATSLTPGLYFVSVKTADRHWYRKLIIE